LPYLLRMPEPPLGNHFNESSFTLEAIIHLFVRCNRKVCTHMLWPETTRIMKRHFKPSAMWQYYLWKCEKGCYEDVASQPNQEWTSLKALAWENEGQELPTLIKEFPILYLCFLCVLPHRIHANGVRWLASRLDEM